MTEHRDDMRAVAAGGEGLLKVDPWEDEKEEDDDWEDPEQVLMREQEEDELHARKRAADRVWWRLQKQAMDEMRNKRKRGLDALDRGEISERAYEALKWKEATRNERRRRRVQGAMHVDRLSTRPVATAPNDTAPAEWDLFYMRAPADAVSSWDTTHPEYRNLLLLRDSMQGDDDDLSLQLTKRKQEGDVLEANAERERQATAALDVEIEERIGKRRRRHEEIRAREAAKTPAQRAKEVAEENIRQLYYTFLREALLTYFAYSYYLSVRFTRYIQYACRQYAWYNTTPVDEERERPKYYREHRKADGDIDDDVDESAENTDEENVVPPTAEDLPLLASFEALYDEHPTIERWMAEFAKAYREPSARNGQRRIPESELRVTRNDVEFFKEVAIEVFGRFTKSKEKMHYAHPIEKELPIAHKEAMGSVAARDETRTANDRRGGLDQERQLRAMGVETHSLDPDADFHDDDGPAYRKRVRDEGKAHEQVLLKARQQAEARVMLTALVSYLDTTYVLSDALYLFLHNECARMYTSNVAPDINREAVAVEMQDVQIPAEYPDAHAMVIDTSSHITTRRTYRWLEDFCDMEERKLRSSDDDDTISSHSLFDEADANFFTSTVKAVQEDGYFFGNFTLKDEDVKDPDAKVRPGRWPLERMIKDLDFYTNVSQPKGTEADVVMNTMTRGVDDDDMERLSLYVTSIVNWLNRHGYNRHYDLLAPGFLATIDELDERARNAMPPPAEGTVVVGFGRGLQQQITEDQETVMNALLSMSAKDKFDLLSNHSRSDFMTAFTIGLNAALAKDIKKQNAERFEADDEARYEKWKAKKAAKAATLREEKEGRINRTKWTDKLSDAYIPQSVRDVARMYIAGILRHLHVMTLPNYIPLPCGPLTCWGQEGGLLPDDAPIDIMIKTSFLPDLDDLITTIAKQNVKDGVDVLNFSQKDHNALMAVLKTQPFRDQLTMVVMGPVFLNKVKLGSNWDRYTEAYARGICRGICGERRFANKNGGNVSSEGASAGPSTGPHADAAPPTVLRPDAAEESTPDAHAGGDPAPEAPMPDTDMAEESPPDAHAGGGPAPKVPMPDTDMAEESPPDAHMGEDPAPEVPMPDTDMNDASGAIRVDAEDTDEDTDDSDNDSGNNSDNDSRYGNDFDFDEYDDENDQDADENDQDADDISSSESGNSSDSGDDIDDDIDDDNNDDNGRASGGPVYRRLTRVPSS